MAKYNIDSADMFKILADFPGQVRHAVEIGNSIQDRLPDSKIRDIFVLGMGGSAIGGDLLRTYITNLGLNNSLRIFTNRNYDIPEFLRQDSYVLASSYSGDTEETLSALDQALQITKHIYCISSGGRLEAKSAELGLPLVKIPGGMQPRCALGYSFFPMLKILMKIGALNEETIRITKAAIDETMILLEEKSKLYSEDSADNPALALAKELDGRIPLVYSSDRLDSVNLRWRCQIQENAKNAAFGNILPEMNHNEVNGFSYPAGFRSSAAVLLLEDSGDHPRTRLRFRALESMLIDQDIPVYKIFSDAKNYLARIFDLIYFGDWISYYLAINNQVDPTPIPLISKLKKYLSGQ